MCFRLFCRAQTSDLKVGSTCTPVRSRYVATLGATVTALAMVFTASTRGAGPRFLSDDPLEIDRDTQFDASKATPINLSEAYDVVENNFGNPGDHQAIRA